MIETINPTDKKHWLECRTKDITSTEIAGLFGFSPYTTEFEIWHTKKAGTIVEIAGNERMKWGTALQDAIAAEIATGTSNILLKYQTDIAKAHEEFANEGSAFRKGGPFSQQ